MYQYSRPELMLGWDFDEAYPGREELRDYFAYVDSKLDLTRDVKFNSRVPQAKFDEGSRRWTVTSADGDLVSTRFLAFS